MEFCVLGALGISANGAGIDLGGVTRRAVLGYLLLHANQVVPASRIRDALWHEDPPPSARKIVQNACPRSARRWPTTPGSRRSC